MDSIIAERPCGGFVFDNCFRNERLIKTTNLPIRMMKTGTTLAGVIYKDGVVLGADTRATEGTIIADKSAEKIHFIADNIYCCGAGTSADTQMVTRMVSSQIELHRLNTGRRPRGHVGAACILGGVDSFGPHLYGVHPHGSSDALPYMTMGSGCLAAMSVLEANFKPQMEKEEAMELVRQAIRAGVFNDLYSGTGVDLCVITKKDTEFLRGFDVSCEKGVRGGRYLPKAGKTEVLQRRLQKVEYDVVTTRVIRDVVVPEPMEM